METNGANEAATAAETLIGLDLQLRRHHYHSPDEDSEALDLIELGAIANLEWDEKDGLWAQLDETITFDITPTRSSICVYLDEEPVATLWEIPTDDGDQWAADWEAELTQSEEQRFLRRISELGKDSTRRIVEAIDQLRAEATEPDQQAFLTTSVREWLAQR